MSEVWLDGTKVTDLSSALTNLGTTPITEFQIGEVQTGRTYDVVFDDAAFGTQPLGRKGVESGSHARSGSARRVARPC